MNIKLNTYRVGVKSDGEIRAFQFFSSFDFDEVVDNFREFAVNHQLRNVIKCLAIAGNAKVSFFNTPDQICARAIEDATEGEIPVIDFWDFDEDRDYAEHNLDFIWNGGQLFAWFPDEGEDRKSARWLSITEYVTDSLIEERHRERFQDMIAECYRGKWLPKGSDYFRELKKLLDYSPYPLVADGFEDANGLLLDELDAIVRNEPVYVESAMKSYKDFDDWDEYEYALNVVQLPEWLKPAE